MKKHFLLVCLLLPHILNAVIIEHDKSRSAYRELAQKPQFRAVGKLWIVTPQGGSIECTGALIDPRTVLTAAHCLQGVSYAEASGFRKRSLGYFALVDDISPPLPEKDLHHISGARVFPECFQRDQEDAQSTYRINKLCGHDIAVVYLERPLLGEHYLPVLASGNIEDFVNHPVQTAGFGKTGTGISVDLVHSDVKLATNMIIDKSVRNEFHGGTMLSTIFLRNANPLPMGSTGNGDSGAPILSFQNGRPMIIGIVSTADSISYYEPPAQGPKRPSQNPFIIGPLCEDCEKCASQDKWVKRPFYGYGSRREFVFTGHYHEFFHDGLASQTAVSMLPNENNLVASWSALSSWRYVEPILALGLPVDEDQSYDDFGARVHYFSAAIESPMMLDTNPRVDSLSISSTGALGIPVDKTLVAQRVDVEGGRLDMNGRLETRIFYLTQKGTVSGSGIVALNIPAREYELSLVNRATRNGNFLNPSGTINLYDPPQPEFLLPSRLEFLRIEGAYHHGKNARLKTGVVFRETGSRASRLTVSDEVMISGGVLEITLNNSDLNTAMHHRLRIPQCRANAQPALARYMLVSARAITGSFDEVVVSANFPINTPLAVSYDVDRIELVVLAMAR